MTIETTRAPEGAKTASTAASRTAASTARPGAAGAPGGSGAGGGFADLMSLLSAADAQAEPVNGSLAEADMALVVASDVPEDSEENMPLAIDKQGLIATTFMPNALPALPADASGCCAPGGASLAAAPSKAPSGALASATGVTAQLASTSLAASDAGNDPGAVGLQAAAANTDVANLLDHRRASQSHAAAQTQLELRQASLQSGHQPALAALDASRAVPVLFNADVLPGAADRREGKPAAGQLRTGLEGALGGTAADRLGINPTYEVVAASAVVPEGQVAETVSYWASQGVQSAELTLDGFGDEPVEVRISVEGDQAQVDFRSNQPEVRQALEGASAQLKALLSGEGLQLTGMSVGTSSRGASQGEGGQPKPSPRQSKLMALEPARSASARAANPAVGQALDLYV